MLLELQPAVTLKEFGQCRQYARRLASMQARMRRSRVVQWANAAREKRKWLFR